MSQLPRGKREGYQEGDPSVDRATGAPKGEIAVKGGARRVITQLPGGLHGLVRLPDGRWAVRLLIPKFMDHEVVFQPIPR